MNNSLTDLPSSESELTSGRKRIFHFWRCFWLTFLVVSIVVVWYCYYVPSNDIVWAGNYASAQLQAAESGKPMILYFTGKWCVPCRIMKRQVWADQQVATLVNERFVPVAIELDNLENSAVMARYKVSGAPVTIITDPQGNALRWRAGGVGKTEFLELLAAPNPDAETSM